MNRTYLCIDLKSFYASVECIDRGLDPLTTNLVVADLGRTEKTICLAVTPSLKSYGVSGRARLFETYLVSGAAIYNTGYKFDDERKMPYPYYKAVDPSRYFQTISASDVCGDDVDFCGDFFDTSILDIKSMYARTRKQEEELEEIYGKSARRDAVSNLQHVSSNVENVSPRISLGTGECRVIRVCRKEGHWDLAVHDYSDASWETYNLKEFPAVKSKIEAEIARRKKIAEEIGVDYEDGSNRLLIECEERYVTSWVPSCLAAQRSL